VAARNATQHDVADRIDFVATSWADGLDGTFDVVVSNPPYVTVAELADADPDVRDFEPRLALDGGPDGLDAYRALLASMRERIAARRLMLEVDPRRAAAVTDLLTSTFDGVQCRVIPDLAGRARIVEALGPDAVRPASPQ